MSPGLIAGARQVTLRNVLDRNGPAVTSTTETTAGAYAREIWNAPSSGAFAIPTATVTELPRAMSCSSGSTQTTSTTPPPHANGVAVAVAVGWTVGEVVSVGVTVGVGVIEGVTVLVGVGQPPGGQGVGVDVGSGVLVAVAVCVGVGVVVAVGGSPMLTWPPLTAVTGILALVMSISCVF